MSSYAWALFPTALPALMSGCNKQTFGLFIKDLLISVSVSMHAVSTSIQTNVVYDIDTRCPLHHEMHACIEHRCAGQIPCQYSLLRYSVACIDSCLGYDP